MKRVAETFDTDFLRTIESMEYNEARLQCLSLIQKSSTKNKKKQALLRDLEAAPNSKELSRIMWNVMLAGEGLATTNSVWQHTYK